MLDLLHKVMKELPELLLDSTEWESLDVTYHAPHVERLWRPYGDGRVMLHLIHPCDDSEALYHPHPWPSAVRIVQGTYEMGISSTSHEEMVGDGPAWTSQHTKLRLVAGSEYEMTDRQGWHYVRPLHEPSWSVMVTGGLYEPPVEMPSPPSVKQKPLSSERFLELLAAWRTFSESNP